MSECIRYLPKYGRFWDYCSICGSTVGDDCWMPRSVDPNYICASCEKAVKAAHEQLEYLNEYNKKLL